MSWRSLFRALQSSCSRFRAALRKSCRRRPGRFRPHLDALEERLAPAVIQWDGGPTGMGTIWNVAANWVGDQLPGTVDGAADVAVIDDAFSGITITSSANVTINRVTSAAALQITAGTFSFAVDSSVTNTFILSGGTLSGAGDLTVRGLDWSSGTMSGTGRTILPAGRSGTISGNVINILARTLDNAGTLSYTGVSLVFGSGTAAGVINNQSGAVFHAVGDGDFGLNSGSNHAFNNLAGATFNRSGPGTTTTFNTGVAFRNQGGTVNVLEGTFQVGGSGTSTGGTFNASTMATLDLSGHTLSGGYTGSGAGTVLLNGTGVVTTNIGSGGASFNFPGTLLQWTGGTLLSGATLTNAGNFTISGLSNKFLELTLNNAGTLSYTGVSLSFFASSTTGAGPGIINNQSGAIFNVVGDGDFALSGGSGNAFNNLAGATFNRSGAGTTTTFNSGVAFNNQGGTINVLEGTFQVGGSGTSTGGTLSAVTVAAVVDLSGHTLSGGYTGSGAGTVLLNGTGVVTTNIGSGGASFNFPGTLLQWTGGTLLSGATLTNAGNFTISGLSNKFLELTLNNAGTLSYTGVSLSFFASSTTGAGPGIINNQSGAIFNVVGDGDFALSGGSGNAFNNLAGAIFNRSGSGTTTTFNSGVAFNNQGGTVNVLEGAFQVGGSGTSTGGTFNASATAILDLSDHTLSGGYTGSGAGTVLLNGSTSGNTTIGTGGASLNFPGTLLQWTVGTLTGATLTNTGNFAIAGGSSKLLGLTLNNAGMVNYTGASLAFFTGSVTAGIINNQSGAIFNALGDGDFSVNSGSGHAFNNQSGATFNRSGTGTTTFASGIAFSNAGTVDIQAGTLQLAGGFTQTAGTTLLNGGDLSSSTTVNLQGGRLAGSGTLTGNVNNSGGAVNPGLSPGSLIISGTYTQGINGTLNIELGGLTAGTQFDRLVIGGAATLNGTLNVTLLGTFSPVVGNSFQIMTFASRTGDFATKNGLVLGGGLLLNPVFAATSLSLVTTAVGLFQFSSASYLIVENGGNAIITVTRTGDGAGAMSVNYATSNGTAAAGTDYTAATGTLNFISGQTSATFAVPVLDDLAVEGNETVNLTLSNPTAGTALGIPSVAVLTILDNDSTTLRVSSFQPTSTGCAVQFSQAVDASFLNLYDTQTGGLGAPDVTVTGATTGIVNGSLVIDPAGTQITFLRTGTVLPPDTYTVTLRSAANGFRRLGTGELLDGNADGIPGDNYTTTFTVTSSTAVIVSVPDFSRGPGQPVVLPASGGTGLPLRLSNGAGVDSVDLILRFNSELLTITGASLGPGVPAGALVEINTTIAGEVQLAFSSPAVLPAGPLDFVILTAQVPTSAGSRYTQKHVLDISNVLVNEGQIAAVDDDGIHFNAYFGDTTGNAGYSAADATLTLRVAVGLDSGFAAYQLADPNVIADITGGGITSTDATRILQEAVGLHQVQIPLLPGVIPPIIVGGPDPFLNIPTHFTAAPGELVTVPVLLDLSDGLESADLAISFDPTRLEVVKVQRGDLTGDFDLFAVNLDARDGTLRAGLGRSAGPIADRGSGSVIEITFRVRDDAPAGPTVLNLRRGIDLTTTQLNEGGLDLIPDPSDDEGDVLDGLISVNSATKQRGAATEAFFRQFGSLGLGADLAALLHTLSRKSRSPGGIKA